jgi:hypothetical protein
VKHSPASFGIALAIAFAFATLASAADLLPATNAAFDRYVQLTEARMNEEAGAQGRFLWVDRLPEAERRATYAQLDRGEIVVSRLETRDRGAPVKIPDGCVTTGSDDVRTGCIADASFR